MSASAEFLNSLVGRRVQIKAKSWKSELTITDFDYIDEGVWFFWHNGAIFYPHTVVFSIKIVGDKLEGTDQGPFR